MSNLAEKLPKFVRTRVERVEAQGRELRERLDKLVDERLPSTVVAPLRADDGLSLKAVKQAANAASDELVAWLKGKRADEAQPEVKPAAKAPAKKAPAKKAPAKASPATATAAKKPRAPRKTAPKKAAAGAKAPVDETPTEG